MDTRPVETALDRRAGFYKKVAWAGILLAGSLYIVGIFGPLELFSPSVTPSLMRDVSARTLVRDADVTRAIREHAPIDVGSGPKLPALRMSSTHSHSPGFVEIRIASLAPTLSVGYQLPRGGS